MLARGGDPDAAAKPLMILFASFPAANLSDQVALAKVAGYQMALRDLPAWAIERAAEKWICGEVDPNATFAPSPPQLKSIAEGVVDAVEGERASLQRLVNAEPLSALPPPPATRSISEKSLRAMVAERPRPVPRVQKMSEAERALIEAARRGEAVTDDMVKAVEEGRS
jgi:hypothetical protein